MTLAKIKHAHKEANNIEEFVSNLFLVHSEDATTIVNKMLMNAKEICDVVDESEDKEMIQTEIDIYESYLV